MIDRIVEIANPARLSVRDAQLVIERAQSDQMSLPFTTPVNEIAVLLLAHPQVVLSQAVLSRIAEAGGGTNNGSILTITNGLNSGRSQTYSYDHMNRLASGQDTSHWGETYTYDNWGNLIATTPISGLAGNNWSIGANTNNQLTALTYDSAGEVTKDQYSNSYSYNAEGRILSGGSGTYVYDGDGNRVKKTVSGTTTLYWPGVGSLLNESNSSGSTMGKQVSFAGLLVWHEDTSGSGLFLFHDQLGSIRVTGDASGNLHDDNDYQSYGTLFNNYGASPSDNHYLFTGYESDSETTSDYAINRNLGLTLGRFSRPDPYDGSYDTTNPQSLNRYSYASNNPLAYVDPSGLADCEDPDGGDAPGCVGSGGGGGWTPAQIATIAAGGFSADGQFNPGPGYGIGAYGTPYGFGPIYTIDGVDATPSMVAAALSSGAIDGYGGGPPGSWSWVANWQKVYTVYPDGEGGVSIDGYTWEDFGQYVLQPSIGSFPELTDGLGGFGGSGGTTISPTQMCSDGSAGTVKTMKVTGYDNSYQSTGKNPGDPGYGITTSGAVAGPGTIAAPRNYPFGTQMYIPGYGWGVVQDRGGAINGAHIDLWFDTTQKAMNWGHPKLAVTVCPPPLHQ